MRRFLCSRFACLGLLYIAGLAVLSPLRAAEATAPVVTGEASPVHLLVPGFTMRELPVQLTSINNVEYAPDGRLFAAGYDGRFHLLRDTDGDGLEDQVITFSTETSANYPLGMVVKDGMPHIVLTDEVVRFRDTKGDGIPNQRETVFKGFDDPALVAAPYLNHRRVDSSMALAYGPDGAWYVTMGNAGYNNPYWQDKTGVAHYTTAQRRGCLLRFTADGKMEQLASGLRYIMSLQFNRHGDLFATDQEGATWCPNGNPFDELLHLQPGRHYGFPPRHPKSLPNVVDEPSVWDYAPQHESTCGFRFNGPLPGRGRFGPEFWADDALVTGESRGNLYRTKLAKTAAGYVARNELFARLGLLAVDCAVSPQGDLVVCCHTGKTTPQPVLTWAASETETVIAFDRPLPTTTVAQLAAQPKIVFGRYVAAGDRFETIRPGYKVVQMQQRQPRTALPVKSVRPGNDGRSLVLETGARNLALVYAISMAGGPDLELAHELDGVAAEWRGAGNVTWRGWLPHPDFAAAREFTRASATHDELWQCVGTAGTLTLRAQLDLWNMLQPATQPTSTLDYTPEPETVTVTFKSDAALAVTLPGATVQRVSDHESRVTVARPQEDRWQSLTLTLATPARALDVSYATTRDPRPRALGTRRWLVPFARPGVHDREDRVLPELAGGNWEKGHELFRGKAACLTCHTLRGEGFNVGPDLNNLVHRDYASVLRDIVEPSAVINPDAVGYTVTLKNGEVLTGTRAGESEETFNLAQPGSQVAKLKKSDIAKTEPMKISLMPEGFDKALTPAELRDLMTYLLTEAPVAKNK